MTYLRDRREARSATHSVRGLSLAYHTWGDPSGTPLMLLHGWMDHGLSFAFTAEALPHGYYCVAPDHRGHGRSDWIGAGGYYHFYDYFNDTVALADHLGFERFSLVGHSMGGSIATGVSGLLGSRIESLILLDGMGPPFHEVERQPERLRIWLASLKTEKMNEGPEGRREARRPMVGGLAEAAERLRRMNPRLPEARALRLAESFAEPWGEEGAVVWRFDPLHRTPSGRAFLRGEAFSLWRAIEAPVLSIWGGLTPWVPDELEARHAALADVSCFVMNDTGHNMHHERPDLVAALVHAWVSGDRDDWDARWSELTPGLPRGRTKSDPV